MARSIIAREDTLLGVCQAIGEDFRFNPVYLRVAFALILFWSPILAVGGYATLGAVVAFSRWMAPDPLPPAADLSEARADEAEPALELPLAA